MRRYLLFLLACSSIAADYISVQSGGRKLVVDLDSAGVRERLKPATPEGNLRLPRYLWPSGEIAPEKASYELSSGMSRATWPSNGNIEQVAAWYAAHLKQNGFQVAPYTIRPKSAMVSARRGEEHVSVTASTLRGQVQFTVTHKPPERSVRGIKLEVVSWDEGAGLLSVKQSGTNDLFYLALRDIEETNLNRAGAVASENGAPDWLPVYPNAMLPRKDAKVMWLGFSPTTQFRTADAPSRVYAWYRRAAEAAGAEIVSEHRNSSAGSVAYGFKCRRGDEVVDIQVSSISYLMVGTGKTPPKETGIGIRYTVPLR